MALAAVAPLVVEPVRRAGREALRVERIADTEGFRALAPAWGELLAESRSREVFLTWEWLFAWWRHRWTRARGLDLLAVRRGDELVGVAPFVRVVSRSWRPLPITALHWLAADAVGADYLDVVARAGEEDAVAEVVAGWLDERRPLVELGRIGAGPSVARRLAERLERCGWRSLRRPDGICPCADLRGLTWKAYLAHRSTSHRQNFRRRLRKLEARFEVRLERVRRREELDPAFSTLLRLHHARWDGRGGSDAFGEPSIVAFHRRFLSLAFDRGWLRFFVLRLDGRAAAALYGLRHGDRFLFYQAGFDPAFAGFGVGLVLMGLTFREAIREGVAEYDLLHGDERYKHHWADRCRPLERIELFPPTFGGRVLLPLRRAARAVRRHVRSPAPGGSG